MSLSSSIPKPRPARVSLNRVLGIVRELHTDAPPLFRTLSDTAIDYQRRCRLAKAEGRNATLKRKPVL
jgi:hypothetical protein